MTCLPWRTTSKCEVEVPDLDSLVGELAAKLTHDVQQEPGKLEADLESALPSAADKVKNIPTVAKDVTEEASEVERKANPDHSALEANVNVDMQAVAQTSGNIMLHRTTCPPSRGWLQRKQQAMVSVNLCVR
jgi:hypothetical protein